MKNIATPMNESRFAAVYGRLGPDNSVTQELTEPRASIEAVIFDVADMQERKLKICFVQIVDLTNLKPVERAPAFFHVHRTSPRRQRPDTPIIRD